MLFRLRRSYPMEVSVCPTPILLTQGKSFVAFGKNYRKGRTTDKEDLCREKRGRPRLRSRALKTRALPISIAGYQDPWGS